MSVFSFRDFSVRQGNSALKVGTDAMVLGALVITENIQKGLDIGAGTGVLALMLAQKNSNLWVDAVELHEGSASDARFNFQESPYAERLQLHELDFLDFSPAHRYDLIVTNPPFYTDALLGQNSVMNAAKHVSAMTPNVLFEGVKKLLTEDGSFWMIWPCEQEKQLLLEASRNGLYPKSHFTIFGKTNAKLRVIFEFTQTQQDLQQKELTIRKANGEYTEAYIALTKDFHDRPL